MIFSVKYSVWLFCQWTFVSEHSADAVASIVCVQTLWSKYYKQNIEQKCWSLKALQEHSDVSHIVYPFDGDDLFEEETVLCQIYRVSSLWVFVLLGSVLRGTDTFAQMRRFLHKSDMYKTALKIT